jgi:hypothetical protein
MNSRNDENLKKLFEKFVEGEQAEQAVEDIQRGERILRSYTAPEPDNKLIVNIKTEIAANLLHKKEILFRKAVYKTMAVAAAFILVAVISVKLFERNKAESERPIAVSKIPTVVSTIPKAVWESECLADDGADSATLVAEVEQIESDLLAMQSDENGGSSYKAVTELEMELSEIDSDFWKG